MALAEKNEKDSAAYEAEVRELKRIIDHDEQLHKFMTIKSNERMEWKREAEKRRQKHGKWGFLGTLTEFILGKTLQL